MLCLSIYKLNKKLFYLMLLKMIIICILNSITQMIKLSRCSKSNQDFIINNLNNKKFENRASLLICSYTMESGNISERLNFFLEKAHKSWIMNRILKEGWRCRCICHWTLMSLFLWFLFTDYVNAVCSLAELLLLEASEATKTKWSIF